MNRIVRTIITVTIVTAIASVSVRAAQSSPSGALAELNSLKDKVKDPDTRTRVSAFHQVWMIALASESSDVKILALDLMKEPVASASDHIRMPAIYAVAEVANSTSDPAVKSKALATLKEPVLSGQLPVRIAAVDAINSVMSSPGSRPLALEAVQLLVEAVRSGNNGIRIPAMNAVAHIALASHNDQAMNAALQALQAPLDSMAMIGGMEVRMMAVVEVERVGSQAQEATTKAKALGMLQSFADNGTWEPEARHRAAQGVALIQSTIKPVSPPSAAGTQARLSVSSTPEAADIELDGNFVGNTPSELSIAEGDHTVRILKAGFKTWERKLKASAGSTIHIEAGLEKASDQQ